MKKLVFIFILIMSLIIENKLYAEEHCGIDYTFCITRNFYTQCDPSVPGNYCQVSYTFCISIDGQGNKNIFISDFSTDENCPCTETLRNQVINWVFDDDDLKNFFDVNDPQIIEIYQVYVANCIRTERTYDDRGNVIIKAIDCDGTGCCKHIFEVHYRWKCNSNPGFTTLSWYQLTQTVNDNANCAVPCFANCYNFTGYSGPPQEKINFLSNQDIVINFKEDNNKYFNDYFKIDSKENQNKLTLNIFTLEGKLIAKSKFDDTITMKQFLNSKGLNDGIYLYEVSFENNQSIRGKLLILK